jgi:hypothetical protein
MATSIQVDIRIKNDEFAFSDVPFYLSYLHGPTLGSLRRGPNSDLKISTICRSAVSAVKSLMKCFGV